MNKMLKIHIGADHGGFEQKNELIKWLTSAGYQLKDCGALSLDLADDYPQIAKSVVESLQNQEKNDQYSLGILLCRSGGGMTMAANRFSGIRAVNAVASDMAKHAREHNDANVIVLSADWSSLDEMKEIVRTFINTPFSGETRHVRRITQLDELVKS